MSGFKAEITINSDVEFLDLVSGKDKNFDYQNYQKNIIFFRGVSSKWDLTPKLGRPENKEYRKNEVKLYLDYSINANLKFERGVTGWNSLFSMQHYGLPTRLLDWSTSFFPALFFALHSAKKNGTDAIVWYFFPSELNKKFDGVGHLGIPSDADPEFSDYYSTFIKKSADYKFAVSAILPVRSNDRIARQQGTFTIHKDLDNPLEILAPECLSKIRIKKEIVPEFLNMLNFLGINDFIVYPDFEGLSDHLLKKYS